MRVPSPGLLKIDKEQLLRDVRTRLAEKYPDYADESQFDATDPAWVILEQAVWIAEMLRCFLSWRLPERRDLFS